MRSLEDTNILYHGSYCEVSVPDLSKGSKYRDFGKGFYLTSSYDQARRFVRLSLQKAKARGLVSPETDSGFVSTFDIRHDHIQALHVLTYETANEDWLHCVVGHRKENTFPEVAERLSPYDVIIGKIANDDTNATITTYMSGGYGIIGSREADNLCIEFLMPERLEDQFCFRSAESLNCLSFRESEVIWIQ